MNKSQLNKTPAPLLHERDAAKFLGMSTAWLQRARWAGTGPSYIRVGGHSGRAIRYRLTDLAQWIEDNAINTLDTKGGTR